MDNNGTVIRLYYSSAVKGVDDTLVQDGELWYNYVLNLSKPEQIIYTIIILNQQVMNGGFMQYFDNTYGIFAELTEENLRLIHAYKTADIVQKVVGLLKQPEMSSEDFRRIVFAQEIPGLENNDPALLQSLRQLGDAYEDLDEEEDIDQLYINYLKSSNQLPIL